jgi:NTP pyrophosphatase (non-canonical NTP hydrolase)
MKEKSFCFNDLQTTVSEYVRERDWEKYHNAKDVAASIVLESAELLEIFQWKKSPDYGEKINNELRKRIGEELADVIIYCACLANSTGIDLSFALTDKLEKNRRKYPVEKVLQAASWDEVANLKNSEK